MTLSLKCWLHILFSEMIHSHLCFSYIYTWICLGINCSLIDMLFCWGIRYYIDFLMPNEWKTSIIHSFRYDEWEYIIIFTVWCENNALLDIHYFFFLLCTDSGVWNSCVPPLNWPWNLGTGHQKRLCQQVASERKPPMACAALCAPLFLQDRDNPSS